MKLAAVLGWPISQSKSPILHGHWLKRYKINGSYIPLAMPPDNFDLLFKALPKMGFLGCNVTVPFKERAFQLADYHSATAKRLKAANTIKFNEDGSISADNTDGYGFIANIKQQNQNWDPKAGTAYVVGAGGASRAVIAALLDEGVPEIILTNRTISRAEKLASDIGGNIKIIKVNESQKYLQDASFVINTTTMGMAGGPDLKFPMEALNSNALVTDLIYNPLITPFLANAQEQGCEVIDGLGMLLHQAVPGFESWFGVQPEADDELRITILQNL